MREDERRKKWVNFCPAGKDFPTGNVTSLSDVNLRPDPQRD